MGELSDMRTVGVRLTADVNGYKTSMKQAADSTTAMDKAQEKAQKNTDKWRAVGMAAQVGGAALAAGLLAAAKAASDQEQALGSLNAVFKVSGSQMTANAKAATQIGLSITDYSNAAAKLGAQLSNLGVDQADLGATTDDLIRKASDLAAQFGGTTQEAVDALGAAMRGEADPAERYGLALNITAVNAEMAATGADKAQAMLALINKQMEKSGSIGAWNREMDTAAARTQMARAEFDNATASLGEALLPALATAAAAAADLLAKFNEMSDGAKTATTVIVAVGAAALLAAPKIIEMAIALKKLNESGGALGTLATKAAAITGAVAGAQAFVTTIGALADKAGQITGLVNEFEALKDTIISLTPGIGPLTQLGDTFRTMIDQTGVLGENSTLLGAAWNFLTQESEVASAGISGVANATSKSAAASWEEVEAKENQAAAVAKATEQYEAYIAAVQQALGLLSARDALIGQEDRLAEAVKKNGNALRGYTEAAAANRAAMGDEVSKIADLVQAKYDETGSLKVANKVRRQHINNLREAAAAAGYDREETERLLDKLNILKPIRTVVTVDGLTGAANEAERLASALSTIVNNSGLGGFGFGGQRRAAGGYITGPGTGTSDDIPAMLSNGEYVMTARATKRLGVGTLDAMNYAGGGLVGYAAGGRVAAAGGGANLAVGAGSALKQVTKWREAVKAARENIRDLQDQAQDYADTIAGNAVSAGGSGLFESFTKSGVIKAWTGLADAQDKVAAASRAVFEAQVAVNTASPSQRAAAVQALADAERDLADAQGEQTAAQTAADAVAPTSANILGRMRERANLVTAYATKVKSLLGKGLSMDLIKQMAGADPIEAGPVLDALLTMTPEALKELGDLDAAASSAAASVGAAVSGTTGAPAMATATVELGVSTDGLKKSLRVADNKFLDKQWRRILANAGLSAEERVQFRQSLADNDGKLTRYWRDILAAAGLSAEERAELRQGIDAADNVTRAQWREKLHKTGLGAEERSELAAELAAAKSPGRALRRYWLDELQETGLSAKESASLWTAITGGNQKVKAAWVDKLQETGLSAKESAALYDEIVRVKNPSGKLRREWIDQLQATGLSAKEATSLVTAISGASGKVKSAWVDKLQATGLSAKEAKELLASITATKGKVDTSWTNRKNDTGLGARDGGIVTDIAKNGNPKVAAGWNNKKHATQLGAKDGGILNDIAKNGDPKARSGWRDKKHDTQLGAKDGGIYADIGAESGPASKPMGKIREGWTSKKKLIGLGAEARAIGADIGGDGETGKPMGILFGAWTSKKKHIGLGAEARAMGAGAGGDIGGALGAVDKDWTSKKKNVGLGAEPRSMGTGPGGDIGAALGAVDQDWTSKKKNVGLGAAADVASINTAITAAKKVINNGFRNFTVNIGGRVNAGRAMGGLIRGPGTGTSDTAGVFALSNGEYVVRAASVSKYGTDFLEAINAGRLASGGPVGFRTTSSAPTSATAGVTLATSGVPVVVQLDNRTIATGQLKLRRQSGGTVTLGG